MKRIVCLTSIALLAACDNNIVQEDAEVGRIGGYVTDLDGTPIEGVTVEAQGLTALSGSRFVVLQAEATLRNHGAPYRYQGDAPAGSAL